jgi:cytochrome c556
MKRSGIWLAYAGVALALGVGGLAAAAGNPVEERQTIMKGVGQSMKEATGYASGQTAWDAAKAKAAMDNVAGAAKKLHALYPKGSDADPKSGADPKIWANKADFDKRLTEMGSLAAAAGKAADQASFKTAFGAVGATCKSCHDVYRKKKTS